MLTKCVRTQNMFINMKNLRLGRTGARDRALQRAHARRLLVTLAGICRELRWTQSSPIVHAAYLEVEDHLTWLADQPRDPGWEREPRKKD